MLLTTHLKAWRGPFVAALCWNIFAMGSLAAQETFEDRGRSTPAPQVTLQLAANSRTDQRMNDREEQSTNATDQKQSLDVFYTLLKESEKAAEKLDRYSAVLEKQVRIDGVLLDPEVIELKVRHEPFSVYLKWPDKHREALFVSGKYDNKILARTTKGLAALKGVWELEPTARKAMEGCRYPITEAGLHKMVQRVSQFYFEDNDSQLMTCEHRADTDGDKPVIIVQIQFPSPEESPYSICKYLFDPESKLLYGLEICEWDHQGQPAGIAEKYIFREIETRNAPTEIEFDAENPEYSLITRK